MSTYMQHAPHDHGATRLVVLARGLGTRMRKQDDHAGITSEQAKVAATGVKAMIPIDRPFLDYVLSAAADAGFTKVCLVIGPEHAEIQAYYRALSPTRLSVDFAFQEQPLGTANAVAAAERWAESEPFVVVNSDNYYPAKSLQALGKLRAPGVALFERAAMLAGSNVAADRIEKFAIAEIDANFLLKRIIEKPDSGTINGLIEAGDGKLYLSMNLWLFNGAIFDACRAIPKSARGEYEITDAVQYLLDRGTAFSVALREEAVLDLSSRGDVAAVARHLKGTEVRL